MIINAAILEDNILFANQLKNLILIWADKNSHNFNIDVFHSAENLFSGNTKYTYYDVIFMDIQLQPDVPSAITGMDIAKKLRLSGFDNDIIFITSYQEYVFEGYNVNAFNFLLKPIQTDKLYPVLNSLIEKYSDKQYVFKNRQSIVSIPYANIIIITSNLHEINIMTSNDTYTDRSSLETIADTLPKSFVRCHKTCIVNLSHITKIEKNTIFLSNKKLQTIGRKYLTTLKNSYLTYIMGGGI